VPQQLTAILQNISWSLYQSILFFAIVYLCWHFVKRFLQSLLKPNVAYLLLLSFLSWGAIRFLLSIFNPKILQFELHLNDTSIYYLQYIAIGIGILYCVVAILKVIRLLPIFFNGNNDHKHLAPYQQADLQYYLEELSDFLKIKTPTLYTSLQNIVPYTKGFAKKIIVLPVALLNQLTEQELEAVLLHEVAHIKRYDHFSNIILLFTEIVLSCNPFAQQIIKQAKLERELACDDWVLSQQIRPMHYAKALQKVAEIQHRQVALQLAMSVQEHDLLFRIKRLFKQDNKRDQQLKLAPFASLLIGMLFIGSVQNGLKLLTNNAKIFGVLQKKEEVVNSNASFTVATIKVKTTIEKKANNIPTINSTKEDFNIATAEIVEVVPIADIASNEPYATIVDNKIAKVNDAVLNLTDTTLLYNNEVTATNIKTVTNEALDKLLSVIAEFDVSENKSIIITSAPLPISVTQEGARNLFYNNVSLKHTTCFNTTTKKWDIILEVFNNETLIGKRLLSINTIKKLSQISL
jgi:beta-lactamase regulating signal transducer with metallopeptidase domain